MTKEISRQRRGMMEVRYSTASSSKAGPHPLRLAVARRSSNADMTKRKSVDNSDIRVSSDFSSMNSLQLYEATGETSTISLVQKGRLVAAPSPSGRGDRDTTTTTTPTTSIATPTSFFPPFFHGAQSKQAVDPFGSDAAEAVVPPDEQAVRMIQAVVAPPSAPLSTTPLFSSQKDKQDRLKSSSSVRVAVKGEFKVWASLLSTKHVSRAF